MNADTLARVLRTQFTYTAFVFKANLEDLTDDDALEQPAPAGNCANWVAGHILSSRAGLLGVLGAEPPFPGDKYARYERTSAPVTGPAGAVPLSEMRADFAATQGPLTAGLKALTEDALAAAAPFSPGNDAKETVGSLLAGLSFHEAYHMGQLGLLRRLVGAEAPLN